MRIWIVCGVLLVLVSNVVLAQDTDDLDSINNSECKRPPVGTYRGSCSAQASQPIEQSPHALHKWTTCLQEKRGWGSGGSRDAYFFGQLIPVWEEEVYEYINLLDKKLTSFDRDFLDKEQRNWEKSRKTALESAQNKPRQSGSVYQLFAVMNVLQFPEKRALELGCRLEKLEVK